MQWEARYNDASLHQFNGDGSENKYADIDRNRLLSFVLYGDDGKPVFELFLDPGQRLIYRRRVRKSPGLADIIIYLVGWQMTVGGENVQSIAYVSEDGQVALAGRWRDDHPWFYSIQAVPSESWK